MKGRKYDFVVAETVTYRLSARGETTANAAEQAGAAYALFASRAPFAGLPTKLKSWGSVSSVALQVWSGGEDVSAEFRRGMERAT